MRRPSREGPSSRARLATLCIAVVLLVLVVVGLPASHNVMYQSAAGIPNPLKGKSLYVFPENYARRALQHERDPVAIGLIRKIAERPVAQWYGEWITDIRNALQTDFTPAKPAELPVLVMYNLPHRDCGQHSSGGATSPVAYRNWVDQFSAGLGTRSAIVVVEPDALPQMDCLPADAAQERYELLRYAVTTLTAKTQAVVYLDAGHARWVAAETMAARLATSGIATADGFSVNVSNYFTNAESLEYADEVSRHLNGAHFVIDSSRNGRGPLSHVDWCNPPGRALGSPPAIVNDVPGLDAYLWIKQPGTSDGTCNGGPPAGQWWRQNALELARNSS
jgi:endoglucanase